MKKYIIALLLMVLVGCNDGQIEPSVVKETKRVIDKNNYYNNVIVVEYDSCEYVRFNVGNMSWGGHKGNCKYCIKRSKKN